MSSHEDAQGRGLLWRAGFSLIPVLVLLVLLELGARVRYLPPVYEAGGPLG